MYDTNYKGKNIQYLQGLQKEIRKLQNYQKKITLGRLQKSCYKISLQGCNIGYKMKEGRNEGLKRGKQVVKQ